MLHLAARAPPELGWQAILRLLNSEGLPGRGAGEYELSLGKITRTLNDDYPEFFERDPNFDIYDEAVALTVGQPLQGIWAGVQGKQKYTNAIRTLRRLVCGAIREGTVRCQMHDGRPYGCELRVDWRCEGEMVVLGLHKEIHIHAISEYTLRPSEGAAEHGGGSLAYRICRHNIEFLDIHPPSLRHWIAEAWWQSCPRVRPCLAFADKAM